MQTRQTWTCVLQLLLLVSSFAVSACGTTAVSAGSDPVNYHLFCLASSEGKSVTCDPQERLASLNSWFKEAVYRPRSTFEVFAVGPDRTGSKRFFIACIPEHWGAPVGKAKSDYLRAAREGAAGNRTGLTVPAGCSAPGQTTPGSTKLVVFPDVSPLQGDVWQKVASGTPPVPLHQSAICDRSPSNRGAACTLSALRKLFDRWVRQALLRPGATFSVEMVGARDTPGPNFQLTVPPDMPLGKRIAFVLGGRLELASLFLGPEGKYASTIVEAISIAAMRLHERSGVYQLHLFSDMIQNTPRPGGVTFEKAPLPARDFLTWVKKSGLAADLRNIPVLVCGLHTGQFGPTGAAYSARLQDTWQKAFQAMGSPEITFFTSCDAAFAASH